MSANFNIAMLRSIQQPLAESMEAIIAQLTRLLAGQTPGAELDQGQHSKLVRGSLEMIGCQAISRLASTLERGCEALAQPERRGWDRDRVEEVSKSLLLLAEGLDDQIKHMLVDNEDLPVRMWPAWAQVYEAMGEPVPTPEDLFEPDPNFEDEKFQPLAIDYLAQVCEGMNERLAQSISQLESSRDGTGVAKALREAERVFNWAYGLRHRRGYQAYWLVMRARMAMGLIQDPALLEDKASWTVLLNEASIELQKFAKDGLRVRPDLLLKVIRPLLEPWPQSWTNAHPALAEMDARMGLSVFWRTVVEVQDQKAQFAVAQFVAHQDELLALLASVRSEWTRYVSGEGRSSDPNIAKGAVGASLYNLSSKKMLFADPSAISMLDEIGRLSDNMPHYDEITEQMSLEFASSVLIVEDSVERRGRFSPEFHEQSRLQQKRLSAAWSGNLRELSSLPIVRWDAKKQERQTRQALTTVFQEIKKDLVAVEEILVEHFKGEHDKPLDRDAMRDTLSLSDAVLRMLDCDPASRVVKALIERIPSIPAQGAVDQDLQDQITMGVTGLTSFLAARESGDGDADHLLASAVKSLLNEPLRRDKDLSLMVPPPELDVDRGAIVEPNDVNDVPVSFDLSDEPQREDDVVSAEPLALEVNDDIPHTVDAVELSEVNDDANNEDQGVEETEAEAELSEEEISALAQSGVWDHPSEKEPDLVYFLLDEAEAVLAEIESQARVLDTDPSNEEARTSLRRQFHTIKGSGRIAGLNAMAQVAWWVENMLTTDEQESPVYRTRTDRVVRFAHEHFTQWFEELRQNSKVWVQAGDLKQDIDMASVFSSAQEDDLLIEPMQGEVSAQEIVFEPAPVLTPSDMGEGQSHLEIVQHDEPLSEIHPSVDLNVEDSPEPERESESESAPESIDSILDQLERGDAPSFDFDGDELPIGNMGEEANIPDLHIDEEVNGIVVVEGLGEFDAELFELFELDASSHVEALRESIKQYESLGEIEVAPMARAAHTLASLAGGLGANSLRHLARSIEKYLDVNPEDRAPETMEIPLTLYLASGVLAMGIEKLYMEKKYLPVSIETIESVESLSSVVSMDREESVDHVDLMDDENEDDALFDEIVNKLATVAEGLQEATLLLIKLSERRK